MNLKQFKKYCSSFKGVTEEYPFDETTLVYKVKGKMFTLTNCNTFELISVKCDPDDAQIIRQMFDSVIPGYYLNKNHWNSIKMDGKIPDKQLKEWIKDSYNLVVKGLSKKIQEELKIK
ncbi:MAG: MmcQ/YjbR family DNA-binding protein [Spirochaetota bacterium]